MDFDLIIIGSGPGGYVAAIRASQLGMKVGVVEKESIGGVCLNWGCIPTKSLLKSAQVFEYAQHADSYGVTISGEVKPDLEKMVERSRGVAEGMSKGVQFLFKKNKIEIVSGFGKLKSETEVEVIDADGISKVISAKNIIIATGAHSKELPNLKQDGQKIIGYREAMTMKTQPKSMVIVGSGAIGSEFAYFYNSIGTQVTLVEFLSEVVPNEDEEVSKTLARNFKKAKMKIMLNSSVEKVDTSGELCQVTIKTPKGDEIIEAEIVLSAVGVTPNIEGIGLENVGVEVERGKVKVDEYYRTNIDGICAIGDIVGGPALAHVASAEGIVCVEKMAGLNPDPVDYKNIPGCTYTTPEISSVGLTETKAKEAGYDVKVGKFPFTASGKASAAGQRDGFVKLVFDANSDELLGAHMIGGNVTEMISELVVARNLKISGHALMKIIHPHPTMSEAIMEAAAAAYDEAIHL
jgi:dihydrolipoamide dehydrogenase